MKRFSCQLSGGRTLSWQESGDGPAVVLLHGWTMTGAVFHEIAAPLAKRFRVLLPDLPGHGLSSPAAGVSIRHLADDLALWLRQVAAAPRLIAGWSLGGMTALSLVAEVGLTPARLALMATTPRFTQSHDWMFGLPQAEVRLLERNLQRRFPQTLGQFFERMFAGESLPAERLREIRRFAVYNEHLPDRECAMRLLNQFSVQDQRELLPKIACPVLVVHGEGDVITPVGAGRYLTQTCVQATLRVFPATGHAPFLSHPEKVAGELEGFAS